MREVNKNITSPSWTLWYEAYITVEYDRYRDRSPVPSDLLLEPDPWVLTERCRSSTLVTTSFLERRKKKVYCYITPKVIVVSQFLEFSEFFDSFINNKSSIIYFSQDM